jgi:RNA polymerase sigma-70 factor (ECF subfamily)
VTFDEFFSESYGGVVQSLALALGDRLGAEDLAQEAFAQAFRRWSRVGSMESPVGWVYVVALNGARRGWRRRARSVEPEITNVVDDHAASVITTVQLRVALAELTTRQRAAVVLRYLADLPIADIAVALDCAPGTIKATLHQALARMRVELEEDEDDERR